MRASRACAALAAASLAALSGSAGAQFTPSPPPGSPPSTVQNRWPDPPKPMQPAQPAPPPQRAPAQARPAPPAPPPQQAHHAPAKPAPHRVARPSGSTVTCSGVFAKDSTHTKLATKYDSRNVVFGQVDGSDGAKIPASILFPNDPKRRLEVLWTDDTTRSGMSVISINGKSQWMAPKGLKLGLTIEALEKLNRKPFKLSGFGADGSASVLGWEGGALSTLPGGCKVGIRLLEGASASQEARATVNGDKAKELLSNDAKVRAVHPSVTEILIGY